MMGAGGTPSMSSSTHLGGTNQQSNARIICERVDVRRVLVRRATSVHVQLRLGKVRHLSVGVDCN